MNKEEISKRAKLYSENIFSGKTEDSQIKTLVNEGVESAFIEKIIAESIKITEERYLQKIEIHLLKTNLEDHLDKFPLIDADKFEVLQRKAHKKIITNCNNLVHEYHEQNKTISEIYNLVGNDYYSLEDVEKQIVNVHLSKQNLKTSRSTFDKIIFTILLSAGLVSLIFTWIFKPEDYLLLITSGITCYSIFFAYFWWKTT